MTHPEQTTDIRNGSAIVDAALELVSKRGSRGATFREIAAQSGCSVSALVSGFGDKSSLMKRCFEHAVMLDKTRVTNFVDECIDMNVPASLAGPYLYALCEGEGAIGGTEYLALCELWVSAGEDAELAAIFSTWLSNRLAGMRRLAIHFGASETAFDFLTLYSLSEGLFARSCAWNGTYRMLSAAGFIETVHLLTGLGPDRSTADIVALSNKFYEFLPEKPVDIETEDATAKGSIIIAAAEIIETDGISALTNRSVAKRAGTSLAATTYHFPSIGDLYIAGFQHVFDNVNMRDASRGTNESFENRLTSFLSDQTNRGGGHFARSRGMAEIALAAARQAIPFEYGLAMRRKRGALTYQMASEAKVSLTRLQAASIALWTSAVSLILVTPEQFRSSVDFEAQAGLLLSRLMNA